MKKVVEINTFSMGSTGKIMFNIATLFRDKGGEILTYSTNFFSKKYQKLPPAPQGHKYYGSYFENLIHFGLAYITGYGETFSFLSTKRLIRQLKEYKPDIIHLHNLHDYCINFPLLFKYIKKNNIKVIWTLHDCWTFTGHCAHFDMIGCEKWKTGCHNCPQYKQYPKSLFDNSSKMYRLKKKWFTGVKDMTLITPSNWLSNLVKLSFLRDYPVKVIHNGIDLSVFKPTESHFREKYNIKDKFIILGVAFGWGIKKGLDVFIELSKRLNERYQIVLVGTDDTVDKNLPSNIISIHRTQNQKELAEIYTACDVFVNPTREEVLGLVNIEALACGTPIITFNTGGSPETIDKTCGFLVEKEDIEGLIEKIEVVRKECLFSKENCILRAQKFDGNERFQEYINLYC